MYKQRGKPLFSLLNLHAILLDTVVALRESFYPSSEVMNFIEFLPIRQFPRPLPRER